MTLPDELRRVLTIGTSQRDSLNNTSTTVDAVVDKREGQFESQLLLKIAGLTLRKQAGFVPRKANRTLIQPCDVDSRPVLSHKSTTHFITMLRGIANKKLEIPQWLRDVTADDEENAPKAWSIDEEAGEIHIPHELFREWCVHVTSLKLRAPEEWLATILYYGQNYEEYQPYLVYLLGKRGIWLAQVIKNQNWKWALETELLPTSHLLQIGREKESTILEELSNLPLTSKHSHSGLDKLLSYHAVWSNVLGRAFIEAMREWNVLDGEPVPIINRVLIQCQYYFPHKEKLNLLNFLSQGKGDWENKVDKLYEAFTFRQALIDELYDSVEK